MEGNIQCRIRSNNLKLSVRGYFQVKICQDTGGLHGLRLGLVLGSAIDA